MPPGAVAVVVAGERSECAQLDPPCAELGCDVAVEPADVVADHGDAEELEIEDGGDRGPEVGPVGFDVPTPVSSELA